MAARELVGGGGSVRGGEQRRGESVRGREREQRGRKRGEGTRGVMGRLGNASVEAGGGRGLSGVRHASPLFVLLAKEEDDKGEEVGWAGWMELGQLWWAAR